MVYAQFPLSKEARFFYLVAYNLPLGGFLAYRACVNTFFFWEKIKIKILYRMQVFGYFYHTDDIDILSINDFENFHVRIKLFLYET